MKRVALRSSMTVLLLSAYNRENNGAIDDFRLAELKAVDLHDEGQVGIRLLHDGMPRMILRLDLTAKENILEISSKYGSNIWANVYVCSDATMAKASEIVDSASIFNDGRQVDSLMPERDVLVKESGGGYLYSIYINVKYGKVFRNPSRGEQDFAAYDLSDGARNLCIQLQWGDMFGSRYYSNVTFVEATKIYSNIVKTPR